ncbi:MAG TPA: hypothetical protein VGO29_04270 [Solirubrobacteraceae bacterium]|jgi:DNA-binding GntR family transcriptional regulator|nr:hypothetical protein [Solirubrobacteraceae bacterium]
MEPREHRPILDALEPGVRDSALPLLREHCERSQAFLAALTPPEADR